MSRIRKSKIKQAGPKKASNHSNFQDILSDIESTILNFFEKNQGLSYRPQDIHDVFQLEDRKLKYLYTETINDLFESGKLSKNNDGSFFVPKEVVDEFTYTGRLEHVSRQHGFVVVEGEEEDIFVDEKSTSP